ncbi:flagellar biosynthetic protein FliO [Hathewaya histolytica]|uniref:flagellar biosynthetic protein FliO n=1 Tax=Hathewaya histolytica TaxID=1498 RepID=UPI003B67F2E2
MNYSVFKMIIQIVIFLPVTLFLIYTIVKYGGNKMQSFNNGRVINIIERTQISKEGFLVVAKIVDKYYLISTTNSKNEILQEIDRERVEHLLQEKSNKENAYINNILVKILPKKEE